MQIWLADFSFELITTAKELKAAKDAQREVKKEYKVVKDVVTIRIPQHHIHKKTDVVARALRDVSDTSEMAKDGLGRWKVVVNYKKYLGNTNG